MKKFLAAATIASCSLMALPALAGNTLGTAFGGYDPVTYFQDQPAQGKAKFFHLWDGALWTFSSEENRDSFKADPITYAPQFDAYCAWAASQGYKRPGDPNVTKKWMANSIPSFTKALETSGARISRSILPMAKPIGIESNLSRIANYIEAAA